ncbi:hypothetical protein M501DRAFT_1026278 [Patellaria atrata CBS 101060]|uniref:5'-deoxynucleotidase n=1 Tax=Patellaria atrata CBS 101060 TaxID=1346257 RepID=A0A9P4S5L2_9PEZI|nr:hypothetical protein M501DRAFT_1026278 [Patellaria atrata CBS 101060]
MTLETGQSNGTTEYSSQRSEPPKWTVDSVLKTLTHPPPTTPTTSPLPFMHMLTRLKSTKREGWRRFKISYGESISDHMYRMSIITLLAPPALRSRLDIGRCTRMALVHDMAELLVGDITPVDGVSKPEKMRRELETMEFLCNGGPSSGGLLSQVPGTGGEEIMALFQEYEDDKTAEAHFVHDVDKLELILQMLEYEQLEEGKIDLGEFTHVAKRIVTPEVKAWTEDILEERRKLWEETVGRVPKGLPWKDWSEEELKKELKEETQKTLAGLKEYYGDLPKENGEKVNRA